MNETQKAIIKQLKEDLEYWKGRRDKYDGPPEYIRGRLEEITYRISVISRMDQT